MTRERSGVAIADVVRDVRAGAVQDPTGDPTLVQAALDTARVPGTVVDVTGIYQAIAADPSPVRVYEDHPNIAPPWKSALTGYVNEHGNVILFSLSAAELAKDDRDPRWDAEPGMDWSRVRWIENVTVWAGGSTHGQSVRTTGPLHMWRFAVYEDGSPAEIRWVQLVPDYALENWDMASLVMLGTLNFMACRNVDIVEPTRSRAESRRIARTGVRVSVINVFPVGRSSRAGKRTGGAGVPLTSVRGHFARYGPGYGRGLLFGKHAGRFWIPQHARGDRALGETGEQRYVLHPETGRVNN